MQERSQAIRRTAVFLGSTRNTPRPKTSPVALSDDSAENPWLTEPPNVISYFERPRPWQCGGAVSNLIWRARLPGEKQRTMLRELIIHITSILKLTSAFPTDGATNAHAPRPPNCSAPAEEYGDESDMLGGPLFNAPRHPSCVRLSLCCHCRHCCARYTPEIYRGQATHRKPLSMRPSIKALPHDLANDWAFQMLLQPSPPNNSSKLIPPGVSPVRPVPARSIWLQYPSPLGKLIASRSAGSSMCGGVSNDGPTLSGVPICRP